MQQKRQTLKKCSYSLSAMSELRRPRLYVGNLPYSAQRNDIMECFAQDGIELYVNAPARITFSS